MMALVLSILFSMSPSEKPVLTCTLAWDVQVASDIMLTYLDGVVTKTNNDIEKLTLGACVEALEQLRQRMIVWEDVNCQKSQ